MIEFEVKLDRAIFEKSLKFILDPLISKLPTKNPFIFIYNSRDPIRPSYSNLFDVISFDGFR